MKQPLIILVWLSGHFIIVVDLPTLPLYSWGSSQVLRWRRRIRSGIRSKGWVFLPESPVVGVSRALQTRYTMKIETNGFDSQMPCGLESLLHSAAQDWLGLVCVYDFRLSDFDFQTTSKFLTQSISHSVFYIHVFRTLDVTWSTDSKPGGSFGDQLLCLIDFSVAYWLALFHILLRLYFGAPSRRNRARQI